MEATTFAPETTGGFTLSIGFGPGGGACAATNIGALTASAPSYATSGAAWASDCESTSDFGSYSRFYKFTVSRNDTVEISLTSTAADAYMYLRWGETTWGFASEFDDDGGAGTNSFIRRAVGAGTWTIEATSKTAAAAGAFTLEVDLLSACEVNLGTASGDQSLYGQWAAGCDSTADPDNYARYYTFTLAANSVVNFRLNTYRNSNAQYIIYIRSGAGRTGTRLAGWFGEGYLHATSVLSAGTYTLETFIYGRSGATGDFALSLEIPTPCAASDLGTLSADHTETGTWTRACDSVRRPLKQAKFYTFTLSSPATVDINLKSTDANPYLFLRSGASPSHASRDAIAADNDGGAGSNSRILQVLGAGSYTVEATTWGAAYTVGDFTLSFGYDAFAACAADTTSLGALTTSARTANGTWVNTWRLRAPPANIRQALPVHAVRARARGLLDNLLRRGRGAVSNARNVRLRSVCRNRRRRIAAAVVRDNAAGVDTGGGDVHGRGDDVQIGRHRQLYADRDAHGGHSAEYGFGQPVPQGLRGGLRDRQARLVGVGVVLRLHNFIAARRVLHILDNGTKTIDL